MSSYDHRITKTYFFVHIFSDINAESLVKQENLVIFTCDNTLWRPSQMFCDEHVVNIIQLLPLCEGNMTVCSPEAGNIARG